MLRAGLVFVALAGVVAPPAWSATNLVVNGGFEAGAFGAWRSFAIGAPDDSFDIRVAESPATATEGRHLAVFGISDLEGIGGITQLLNTVPGEVYRVQFQLRLLIPPLTPPDAFANLVVGWGGTPDAWATNIGNQQRWPGWRPVELELTADRPRTGLTFGFGGEEALVWLLDDVRVTRRDVTTPAPIPEPSSWALMIAGFGLAGAALRRRAQPGVTEPSVTR